MEKNLRERTRKVFIVLLQREEVSCVKGGGIE